jgi:hypothetical protein
MCPGLGEFPVGALQPSLPDHTGEVTDVGRPDAGFGRSLDTGAENCVDADLGRTRARVLASNFRNDGVFYQPVHEPFDSDRA